MSDIRECFKRADYGLSNLMHYFDIADVGLRDAEVGRSA